MQNFHYLIFLILYFISYCQDNQKSDPGVSESGDGKTNIDFKAEANASPKPDGSLDLADGGKKDPTLRRKELLVNSGLAKVFCFSVFTIAYIVSCLSDQMCNVKFTISSQLSLLDSLNLATSFVLQCLVDSCIESASEFLRSNFGKDLIYEVVPFVCQASDSFLAYCDIL